MQTSSRNTDRSNSVGRSKWKWIVLGVLFLAAAGAWFLLPVAEWARSLQAWIESFGSWGPLIFGVIFVIAVVLLVPGAALSLAAGFAYGLWGLPLAVVAATIGASIAFLIARYVAQDKVRALVKGRKKLQAVEKAVSEGGWKIVGLVRLSPLVPFNMQNYFFGITRIPFVQYAAATFIGIIPGTAVNIYVGTIGGLVSEDKAVSPVQWGFFAVGLVVSVIVVWMITHKAKKKLAQAGVDEQE